MNLPAPFLYPVLLTLSFFGFLLTLSSLDQEHHVPHHLRD